MNRKGQLGDVLEFKISLIILAILSLLFFVFLFVPASKSSSPSVQIPLLQKQILSMDLLSAYLTEDLLADYLAAQDIASARSLSPKVLPLTVRYDYTKDQYSAFDTVGELNTYHMVYYQNPDAIPTATFLLPYYREDKILLVSLMEVNSG